MLIRPVFTILIYLEKRLHEIAYVNPRSLSIFRIIFASFHLFVFGVPRHSWISQFPDIFFNPPVLSIAALFSGFPPAAFFQVVDFLLPLLFVLLLFGYRTRYVSLILSLLIIICNSFQYSFGKIDHGIIIELTLLLMAFSDWGKYYSIDSYNRIQNKLGKKRNYATSLLALCIGFGFFTAAVPKYTWIDLDLSTQAVRGWLNTTYYVKKLDKYLVGYFMDLKSNLFWEVMDSLGFLFEITFIAACFVSRRIFRVWLCFAVFFHLTIYLMLNIAFVKQVLIYGAFVDWSKVFPANNKERGSRTCSRNIRKWLLMVLGMVLLCMTTLGLLGISYRSLRSLFFSSYDIKLFIFLFSAVIAVYYLLSILYRYLFSDRRTNTAHDP